MLDSPEKTTSELVQRLDMRGNWEGSFDDPKDIAKNCLFEYRRSTFFKGSPYIRGTLWTKDQGYVEMGITDEGKGFLKVAREVGTTLGIYKQDGNKVVICYREREGTRPTSFRISDNQHLLILRRVNKKQGKGQKGDSAN